MHNTMEVYCEVNPLDIPADSVSENSLSPSDSISQYFIVKVQYDVNFYILDQNNNSWPICDTSEHVNSYIPKETIQQETCRLLSWLNVPEEAHGFILEKVSTCANRMVNVTHKNHKILYMNVVMSITQLDEDDDGVVGESTEDPGVGLVPASKSAIDGLKRVKVMENCNCAICLEDFEVDSEGVRMPCLHLFHEVCMVNWLRQGHSCPLCRFEMPTSESEREHR